MFAARSLAEDLWYGTDPVAFSRLARIDPDPWQQKLLRSQARRILLNCSRQSGKSTTASTIATHTALYTYEQTIIILAPGLRQGQELHRKVLQTYRILGKPIKALAENKLSLELERATERQYRWGLYEDEDELALETIDSGSRILCLPGSEATVRGISGVDLLIVEEASRVPQDLYAAVRPMLATKPKAREMQMSTPFGNRGFFFDTWRDIQMGILRNWEYYEVPAEQCPRISAEYLEEEKRRIGEWWFEQEYHCQFLDAETSAFQRKYVDAAFSQENELWQL